MVPAPRKKVSKKKAVAKRTSTAMTNPKERMSSMIEDQNLSEGGDGNFISVKGGEFSYRGTDLGSELPVVILAFCQDYTFYDSKFDTDNPKPPACFAVADVKPRDLTPHEDAPKPQADECDACELNEFGSDGGKGKACRNHYRLAVIPADSDFENAEIAFIRISPTGYRRFESYVKKLKNKHSIHPIGCVTELSFDPDVDYESIICTMQEEIVDDDTLNVLLNRYDEASSAVVEHGYVVDQYEEPKAAPRKKVTKKRAARR